MSLTSSAFFSKQKVPAWPNLSNSSPIHQDYASRHNTKGSGRLGKGFLKAVVTTLMGEARVYQLIDKITVTRADSNGDFNVVQSEMHRSGRAWSGHLDGVNPFLLCLAEAALGYGADDEVKCAWESLRGSLAATVGRSGRFTENDLIAVSDDPDANAQMLHLCDALYFAVRHFEASQHVYAPVMRSMPLDVEGAEVTARLFGAANSPTARPTSAALATPAVLKDLIATGGVGLLVGDTATLKSSMAMQAALDAGVGLVVTAGSPGVEDRDLIGGPYPGVDWVDGDLAEAYRRARSAPTMLLIDEALRFEPGHLNVLVGALDVRSADVVRAMGLSPLTEEDHYVLKLFNGERLVALKRHLTVVLTTNMGEQFLQSARDFDDALLRRVDVIVEVDAPSRTVSEPIYRSIFDDDMAVELAYALDTFVRAQDGFFARKTNLGVLKNFLRQLKLLITAGHPYADAVHAAVKLTVASYVCAREPDGSLAAQDVGTLMDEVARHV